MPFRVIPSAPAVAGATAFTTVVPLDSLRYMPRQSIAGALAFAPGTIVAGGSCSVALISNGSNVPTFTGMVEDSSSQGWYAAQYAVNNVTFWADDTTVYYAIRQAATVQYAYPAATAYALTGPASPAAGSAATYTVQDNGTLSSPVTVTPSDGGAGGTFNPTSVTIGAGFQASATFTYTPKAAGSVSLSTANSGGLANPAALPLTVTATSSTQYIRLTGLSYLTESVDGSGYDYTPTAAGGGNYSNNYGVSSKALPAGADGFFGATNKAATPLGLIMGIGATSSAGAFSSTVDYGLFADTSGGNTSWQVISAKAGGTAAQASVPIAAGDTARVRRAGSTIYAEVQAAGASTWSTVYTWTGASTAAMYAHIQCQNTGDAIVLPIASANVA